MGHQDVSLHEEVKCLSEIRVSTTAFHDNLPPPSLEAVIYIVQLVIKMPSIAQYSVGCSDTRDTELEILQNPNNSKFEAALIATGQSPPQAVELCQ